MGGVVVVGYRGLIPLMLWVVTTEQALRIGIGLAKPLATRHTPPGALSWVLLPVAAAALFAVTADPASGRPGGGAAPGVGSGGASRAPATR